MSKPEICNYERQHFGGDRVPGGDDSPALWAGRRLTDRELKFHGVTTLAKVEAENDRLRQQRREQKARERARKAAAAALRAERRCRGCGGESLPVEAAKGCICAACLKLERADLYRRRREKRSLT